MANPHCRTHSKKRLALVDINPDDEKADLYNYCAFCPKATFIKSQNDKPENNNHLVGALLAVANEINGADGKLNIETLAAVAANGMLDARIMYKGQLNFRSTAFMILQGNSIAGMSIPHPGLRRRMRALRFNNLQQDTEGSMDSTELANIFKKERHIILWWLWDGARKFVDNGSKMIDCPDVEKETNVHFSNSNTVLDDLEYVLIEDPKSIAYYADILEAMHKSNPAGGYDKKGSSGNQFLGTAMASNAELVKAKDRITASKGVRGGSVLRGYRIRTEFDGDEPPPADSVQNQSNVPTPEERKGMTQRFGESDEDMCLRIFGKPSSELTDDEMSEYVAIETDADPGF